MRCEHLYRLNFCTAKAWLRVNSARSRRKEKFYTANMEIKGTLLLALLGNVTVLMQSVILQMQLSKHKGDGVLASFHRLKIRIKKGEHLSMKQREHWVGMFLHPSN